MRLWCCSGAGRLLGSSAQSQFREQIEYYFGEKITDCYLLAEILSAHDVSGSSQRGGYEAAVRQCGVLACRCGFRVIKRHKQNFWVFLSKNPVLERNLTIRLWLIRLYVRERGMILVMLSVIRGFGY